MTKFYDMTRDEQIQFHVERADQRLTAALDAAFDTFPSKAARKAVLDDLSRAYEHASRAYGIMYRKDLFASDEAHGGRDNWDAAAFLDAREVPFDLHHVRERHVARIAEYSQALADLVRAAFDARTDVKDTPVEAPVKTNVETEERKIAIQKSVRSEMERLGRMYHDALELGRLFNGLPVTANVHLVTNQYGTTFVRAFYYLNGERTPINVIMAAAGTLADEKEGRA